jgi:hypothetical protein
MNVLNIIEFSGFDQLVAEDTLYLEVYTKYMKEIIIFQ